MHRCTAWQALVYHEVAGAKHTSHDIGPALVECMAASLQTQTFERWRAMSIAISVTQDNGHNDFPFVATRTYPTFH